MRSNKLFAVLLALSVSTLTFVGCKDSDDSVTPTPNATGKVMAIHSSPNAPGVDLLVDGTVAGTNLTFPNNTSYLSVTAGTRNVKVNVTGTTTTRDQRAA